MKNKYNMKWLTMMCVVMITTLSSCDDNKSYAELLDEETEAVNWFLASQRVVASIPADSVFEVGEYAPFYKMDEEGNVYMQVLNVGNLDEKAQEDQQIYFRFMRYNLTYWYSTGYSLSENPYSWKTDWDGEGNANDMEYNAMSFRFGNYTLSSSSQYGSGIQLPLYYLGIDCEVNIVIKSQYGIQSEISNVIPFLYNIRYYKKNT